MIRVDVNLKECDKHGQCLLAAPDIFAFDDAGELVFRAEIGDDELTAAEEAELLCPVQVITVGRVPTTEQAAR